MTSSFEVDSNCPYCLDDIVAALRGRPTVTNVESNMASGCVSVTHSTDEAELARLITDIGHRIVVADNGEIVQGDLSATPRSACGTHS